MMAHKKFIPLVLAASTFLQTFSHASVCVPMQDDCLQNGQATPHEGATRQEGIAPLRYFSKADLINLEDLERIGNKPEGTSGGERAGIYKDPKTGKSYYIKQSNFFATLFGSAVLNAVYPQGSAKDSVAYAEEGGERSYYIASETLEGFKPFAQLESAPPMATHLDDGVTLCALQNFLQLASRHSSNNGLVYKPDGTMIPAAIDYDRTSQAGIRWHTLLKCPGIRGDIPHEALSVKYRELLAPSFVMSVLSTIVEIKNFLQNEKIAVPNAYFTEAVDDLLLFLFDTTYELRQTYSYHQNIFLEGMSYFLKGVNYFLKGADHVLFFLYDIPYASRQPYVYDQPAIFHEYDFGKLASLLVAADIKSSRALEYAVEKGDKESVETLLKMGVQRGWANPLDIAVKCGHKEIVKVLLAAGVRDEKGGWALKLAKSSSHTEIVKMLEEASQ